MSETKTVALADSAHELGKQEPSLRFVGSLARAAHQGIVLGEHRPTGVKRDIDAFRTGSREQPLEVPDGTDLDLHFEHWIRPEANGTYLVFPNDERISVEVPHADEVFALHEAKVDGTTVPTVHADVLGAISTMMYIQRPKDKKTTQLYGDYLDSLDPTERFDPELLEPFNVFRDEISKQKKYVARAQLRNAYYRAVPEKLRKQWVISEKINALRPGSH